MKTSQLIIIIAALSFCFCACKKSVPDSYVDQTSLNAALDTTITIIPPKASIVGTWYETSQRIQRLNITSGKITDTTYSDPLITPSDNIKFNSDNSASISQSPGNKHNALGTAADAAGRIVVLTPQNLVYHIYGSLLVLSSKVRPPLADEFSAGPMVETMVRLDAINLFLHIVARSGTIITVTDTYFAR